MPQYRVWYKGNAEPLEFASIGRLSDSQIVDKVLETEHIAPKLASGDNSGQAGDVHASLSTIIERNGLGPLKYTMDESEMIVIS